MLTYTALHFDRILQRGYGLDPAKCPTFWSKVVKFIQLSLMYKIRGVVIHEKDDPVPVPGEACVSMNDLSLLVRLVFRLDPWGRHLFLQYLLCEPSSARAFSHVDFESLYVRMMRERFGDVYSREELGFELLLLLSKDGVPIHK